MCIRDSHRNALGTGGQVESVSPRAVPDGRYSPFESRRVHACLLYTSDAADERSSVDLGGRRIIKKKKNDNDAVSTATLTI